jgi:hypothetical protein
MLYYLNQLKLSTQGNIMQIFSEEDFNKIKAFNSEITMYDCEKFKTPVDAILANEAHIVSPEFDTADFSHVMDFYTGAYHIVKALKKDNMVFSYLYYGYDIVRDLIDQDKQFRSDRDVEAYDYMVAFLANLITSLETDIVLSGNKSFTNEDLDSDAIDEIFKADYLGQASISGISIRTAIKIAEKDELKSKNNIDSVKKYIEEHKAENEIFNKVMTYQHKMVMYNKVDHNNVKSAIISDAVNNIEIDVPNLDLYCIKDFLCGADNIINVVNNMDKTGLVEMSSEWVIYGYNINDLWDCLDSWNKKPDTERDFDGKDILILVLQRILEKAECSLILDNSTTLSFDMINHKNLDVIMKHEFNGTAIIDDVVDLSIEQAIKHLQKNEHKYEELEF